MDDTCDASEENQEILEWSDNECARLFQKDYFPSSVKDVSVQKRIIIRFLNFYLGARGQKGIGVPDLVFSVLSVMPCSPYRDAIMWYDEFFRDDGTLFHLTPEDKLGADFKNIVNLRMQASEEENIVNTPPPQPAPSVPEKSEKSASSSSSKSINLLEESDSDHDEDNVINRMVNVSNAAIESNDSIPSNPFLLDIKFEPKPIEKENTSILYGPVENAAFNMWCTRMLGRWEEEQARATLKYFFAVAALVLMRATAKGYKHLHSTFHSENFLRLLRHIKILEPELQYCPPHKRCLKAAYRTFCKKDNNTPSMFAKLLFYSIGHRDKNTKYVLRNGLTNYTADYGFNLVNLWRSIHTEVGNIAHLKRIVQVTTNDQTEASWERLNKFLTRYKGPGSKQATYRWARVMDPRFFRELSCQANYELAVILAVFAERISGNTGIWNSTWVNKDQLDALKQLGEQLYEKYESSKGSET